MLFISQCCSTCADKSGPCEGSRPAMAVCKPRQGYSPAPYRCAPGSNEWTSCAKPKELCVPHVNFADLTNTAAQERSNMKGKKEGDWTVETWQSMTFLATLPPVGP